MKRIFLSVVKSLTILSPGYTDTNIQPDDVPTCSRFLKYRGLGLSSALVLPTLELRVEMWYLYYKINKRPKRYC